MRIKRRVPALGLGADRAPTHGGDQLTVNRKHTVALAAFAVAAALVAGCSSPDARNDYVDTVNEIQTNALQAVNQSSVAQPNSKGEVIEQLEAAEQVLADAVTELEQVEVPDEAEGGHPKLVAGIDEMRGLFADAADRVDGASNANAFAELTALAAETETIGAEIDSAIDQINQDLGAE